MAILSLKHVQSITFVNSSFGELSLLTKPCLIVLVNHVMAKVAFKKIHEETCCEFRAILAAKGTKAQTTQQKVS